MSDLDDVLICKAEHRDIHCDMCNLNDGQPCKLDRASKELAKLRADLALTYELANALQGFLDYLEGAYEDNPEVIAARAVLAKLEAAE